MELVLDEVSAKQRFAALRSAAAAGRQHWSAANAPGWSASSVELVIDEVLAKRRIAALRSAAAALAGGECAGLVSIISGARAG